MDPRLTKGHYYYKSRLSDKEKKIFDKLLDGFMNYEKNILVINCSQNEISNIYNSLKQDVPFLFFVKSIGYTYSPVFRSMVVIPEYRFDKATMEQNLNAVLFKAREIVNRCSSLSVEEKVRYIHDYLCENVIYDKQFSDSSYECVGPLFFGKGVCSGISNAAKLLFDLLDIPSLVVSGDSTSPQNAGSSNEGHAWNIVYFNNQCYHLDITFDNGMSSHGINRYDYYNLSDKEILIDHTCNLQELPPCNTSWGYYKRNKLFFDSKIQLKKELVIQMTKGRKDIVVQVGFSTNLSDMANIAQQCLMLRGGGVSVLGNEEFNIYHIHVS